VIHAKSQKAEAAIPVLLSVTDPVLAGLPQDISRDALKVKLESQSDVGELTYWTGIADAVMRTYAREWASRQAGIRKETADQLEQAIEKVGLLLDVTDPPHANLEEDTAEATLKTKLENQATELGAENAAGRPLDLSRWDSFFNTDQAGVTDLKDFYDNKWKEINKKEAQTQLEAAERELGEMLGVRSHLDRPGEMRM
jgi:hypothetical protein